MSELMQYFKASSDMRVWLVQVFVVVFATVSVNYMLMRLLDGVKRVVQKTASLWDDALINAARLPIRLFA